MTEGEKKKEEEEKAKILIEDGTLSALGYGDLINQNCQMPNQD